MGDNGKMLANSIGQDLLKTNGGVVWLPLGDFRAGYTRLIKGEPAVTQLVNDSPDGYRKCSVAPGGAMACQDVQDAPSDY